MPEEVIVVRESENLSGTVSVSGAKNSALKLIAASILGQGESAIHNVPLISDIDIMCRVVERLGGKVVREGHTLRIDTTDVADRETPYELVSKMRASISALGPMVARFGHARMAMPGGCQMRADLMAPPCDQFNLQEGQGLFSVFLCRPADGHISCQNPLRVLHAL